MMIRHYPLKEKLMLYQQSPTLVEQTALAELEVRHEQYFASIKPF